MLTEDQIQQISREKKIPVKEVRRAEKYVREHPVDHIQPSDPRFKEIYKDKEVING